VARRGFESMLCVSAPETQAGSARIAGGPGVATAPTSGPP
jgi:hypothetical protein